MAWNLLDATQAAGMPAPEFKGNPDHHQYVMNNMSYLLDDSILSAARAGLLAVTLLCFALAFASWRRSGRRDLQQIMAGTQALSELTQRLAAQVAAMELRLEDRRELAAAASGSPQRGYELAMQMARNGAAVEQIASTSGLAMNEAQLLASLHGPARH
jgi:hypothetical protein